MKKQYQSLEGLSLHSMRITLFPALDLEMVSYTLAYTSIQLENLSIVVRNFKLPSIAATTHDQKVFSFFPDNRPCNGFEEALQRYREIVPQLRLAGLFM